MDEKQKSILSLALVVVLLAIAWWQLWPLDKKIRQGLDIKGGVSVILTAKGVKGGAPNETEMSRAEIVLRNRVDQLGVAEASVQREGQDSLLVQLPGVQNTKEALAAIGSTGKLEFIDWQSLDTSTATTWDDYLGKIDKGIRADQPAKLVEGTYKVFLAGNRITGASVGVESASNNPVVNLTFDKQGTQEWAVVTQANVNKRIGIVLDGVPQSAPQVINAILDGNTQISGGFTPDQAKRLAAVLQSGALPVELTFSSTEIVGPTLGQDALAAGVIAALAGLALVALYLMAFYRGLGVTTALSLMVFSSLFLGVLAVIGQFGAFALTLPGIAGMVLTVGMAADSSILMMERVKEEVAMGKTYRSAAKSGTRHGFGTSVDADVVTLVSAVMLYAIAIGPVKGFAFTLMLGIGIDLFVAWFFKRSLIMLLAESWFPKAPWWFGLKGGGADA